MRFVIRAGLLALACSFAAPVLATPATDSLSNCLIDHSTGLDRKTLARWIFISVAVHPAIGDLFSVKPETRDAINKASADVLMRLTTVDCTTEMRAAADEDSGLAMRTAFGKLGEVAVGELTSNKNVQAEFSNLYRYMDKDALKRVLGQK